VRARSSAPADSGISATLRDLAGAVMPLSVRNLASEISSKLERVPTELNEYGYDPFGFSLETAKRLLLPSALMYRHYFRVETHDIDRVPAGRALLICNHAGQIAFDGAMLGAAMILDADPPRLCRPMAEYWISELPWVNVLAARSGTLVGTPENCVSMLDRGEIVMAFPEGVRGMNKVYSERYQLQRFGTGFMRLALSTNTPIVPVACIGSEEQNPGIANLKGLGRMLGMPSFPITYTFPWLGPLGILPLPVKYHFYFGEPIQFDGDERDDDRSVAQKVDIVRDAIHSLFTRGLSERKGIFS
jgi:1-acyl-sn-glycerol-3-phosphate acyltransferase